MNFFDSLSLRSRFLIAPLIGLILTLIIFYSSNAIIQSQTNILKQLNQSNLPQISEISRSVILLAMNHENLQILLHSAEQTPDEEKIYLEGRVILDELHYLEQQLNKTLGSTSKIIDDKDIFEQIKFCFSQYREQTINAIELSTVKPDVADGEMHKATMILRELNDLFMVISDYYVMNLTAQSGVVESSLYNQSSLTVLSMLLLAIMVLSALFFSKRMSSEINLVNKSLISISEGEKEINLPEIPNKNNNMHQLYSAVYRFKRSLEKNEEQQVKLNRTIGELTDSKERYFNLLDLIPTAIVAINDSQEVVVFNKAAEKIFAYDSREIIGKSMEILVPEAHRHIHMRSVQVFKNSDKESIPTLNRKPVTALKRDGERFYIEANAAKLTLADETIMTFAITDVTGRMKAEKEILYRAHYDTLTDLPNRFLALDYLAQGLKDAQSKKEILAVLFLDLDGFKKINDTLGHEAGDKLLIEAGKRLKNAVREDDIVARLGGDEFIVILFELHESVEAVPIVQKVVEHFRKPFEIDDRELILTSSIGISTFPEDGDSASELLRKADSAMYGSKESGRNTYTFFNESMNLAVSRELAIEEQIHGALKRREFRLVYQFQIDIRSGERIGAEALIRWNNHILGEVSPEEFIPIAEHTGLIIPLSKFVFKESLRMLAQWQNIHGSAFRMAINLSPRQFRDPNLISFIEKTLRKSGVSANTVELEVTEGVLMSGHSFIDEALKSLSNLGIRLAMDDFGTGYSSLSYLRRYSFDTLKIDRTFIKDITVGSPNFELVNAIIAMAHALGLEVVAEGVETNVQLEYLTKRNCEYAQGYLFNKPMTSDEVAEILKAQKEQTRDRLKEDEKIVQELLNELVL